MSFLTKITNKLNVFLLVGKDYFWLRVVNIQIPKLFYFVYSMNLMRYSKNKSYSSPLFYSFSQLNDFKKKSEELFIKSKNQLMNSSVQLETYQFNNLKNNFMTALLIVPVGWCDTDSSFGVIHSPFIDYFKEGLICNNLKVHILEVDNNCTLPPDLQFSSFNFIFIWSLSQLDPNLEVFRQLRSLKSNEKTVNSFPLVVGIISAPLADKQSIALVLRHKKLVTDLIYHEEKTPMLSQLEKYFNLHHMPYIQKFTNVGLINSNFTPSVYISCRIKQNRLSWVLIAKYYSLKIGIKHSINVYFDSLSAVGLMKSYRPIQLVDAERAQYGFSFTMSHRTPNSDSHLLGSFWDSYKLGVIPLVQMQNLCPVSSYMQPFLDYFPIIDESDLATVLILSVSYPDHFKKLRERIQARMVLEFNPKITLSKLLVRLTQESV